nr:MAG TPA: hypothetical protein [Caudoviricetes sp.]
MHCSAELDACQLLQEGIMMGENFWSGKLQGWTTTQVILHNAGI